MGRGRGQSPQKGLSGIQGRVYAIIPPTKPVDQLAIQGMFMLSRLWAKILLILVYHIHLFLHQS